MCALVFSLRKVPIFGPGGGCAPLGDPTNPSYSVAASDKIAAKSRNEAAKDADAARLHSFNLSRSPSAGVNGDATNEAAGRGGGEHSALTSIPEIMSPNASTIMQSSARDAVTDVEQENDIADVLSDNRLLTKPLVGSILVPSLEQKTQPRGRSKARLTAPTRTSRTEEDEVERVRSRVLVGNAQPSQPFQPIKVGRYEGGRH
jgi:hypothetical protein